MKRIVIIGGGISGLSAAYFLLKKAKAVDLPLELMVVESGQRWGGKILTDRQDGFVIEGGPDTFLATKPWAVNLCKELGIDGRLNGTNPHSNRTYILHRGRLEPLPEGLAMMIPTRFGPMLKTSLLSWPAKARMGLDYFLPARPMNGDESLGAFVSRRLGRTAYERLIEPLMSGIYAGDGDQLSLLSTFPYLRDLEINHGGLVKGALNYRRKMSKTGGKATGSRSAFLTPLTGLAEIVEKLVATLDEQGVELRLGTPVESIRIADHSYRVQPGRGDAVEADGLVLATPAYITGNLLSEIDPGLADNLQSIPYVSTATISLAYRQEEMPGPLDGYGYVIPRREGRRALACTWTSTKFPHRAPQGYVLLRVFVGRAGQEEGLPRDEASLLQLAQEELRLTLGINAQPVLSRVFYWEQAMPQYNLGHPARLERIEAALARHPGLALAGNGYRGIGIPDCIHSGEVAAQKLVELFGENPLARIALNEASS